MSKERKTNLELLTEVMEGFDPEFFLDENMKRHIQVTVDGVKRAMPIRSREFEELLQRTFYQAEKRLLDSKSLNGYLSISSLESADSEDIRELPLRVARDENAIILDLGRKDGQQVRITTEGWSVVQQKKLFRRSSMPMQIPKEGGSLNTLKELLNITDPEQMLLVMVTLVSWLYPDISKPVLVLTGTQGSAKTTTSRILKTIVDPAPGSVAAMSRSERSMELVISNNLVSIFDNLSGISQDTSDFLCGVVTGQSVVHRKLYTDDTPMITSFHRNLILNGISSVVKKPDLQDRCILIDLKRIPDSKRQCDDDIFSKLEASLPEILGSVLTTLSKAMALMETAAQITFPLNRLADFTKVGYFVAEAMEDGGGRKFLEAYSSNINEITTEIIESYPIIDPLLHFTESLKLPMDFQVRDFYTRFCSHVKNKCAPYVRKNLPGAPNVFSRQLRSCLGSIEKRGIAFEFLRKNDGHYIRISLTEPSPNVIVSEGVPNSDTGTDTKTDTENPLGQCQESKDSCGLKAS